MHDRAEGRSITGATYELTPLAEERLDTQEREGVESGFKRRFMSALQGAMACFQGVDQTQSLEVIVETREFQEVYEKMKSDVERGFEGLSRMNEDKPLDRWAGRLRLAEQTRLLIGAPILMQAYFERVNNPEAPWPPSAATECRSAYNYGSNTREAFRELLSPSFNFGIRGLLQDGYMYAQEYGGKNAPRIDKGHPVADESNVIAQMYLLAHSDLRGFGAPVTPYMGTKYELKAILETSSWLAPLLAEWQTASGSLVTESGLDAFFEYFTKRYGASPRVTREELYSAMNEGRQIYREDLENVSAHDRECLKAQGILKQCIDRQQDTKNELDSVMYKIEGAETALINWNWASEQELGNVDQRTVSRYSESVKLLKERPEVQRLHDQRFELFNTFPDRKHDEHEEARLEIRALTHERNQLIKERARSLLPRTKETLRLRAEEIDKRIDALTESSLSRFQFQHDDFMKAMIAAEHAEKDLPVLRARQEVLVHRLKRYAEAIQVQRDILDEEQEIINDWSSVYVGSKRSSFK